MYLPQAIDQARVLILVKTYPLPNNAYGETVCTAGLLDGAKWIRIYPISWHVLKDEAKYPKYSWIELNLVRNDHDFRPESYKPRMGFDEDIRVTSTLGTGDAWEARKLHVLTEVFTSMQDLISLAKSAEPKSLATFKPAEILDLVIEEEPEKNWKRSWLLQSAQPSMFDIGSNGIVRQQRLVKKLPYRFKYKFLCTGENRPRELTIQDWEIGALFWNCLRRSGGDEGVAKGQVKQKYLRDFTNNKDIYLFLGTNFIYHRKNAPNPFIIVGVFYPPKTPQLSMFQATTGVQ